MTVARPIWMQAAGADTPLQYSAQELRAMFNAMFQTEGVVPLSSTALKVVQRAAGANFSVDINPGMAAIIGDDVTAQGMYLVNVSATENVPTPAAPGSGTRVHRVVLQVRDKLHNGAYTTYDAVPQLLQDTGSGTPALPGSAISLGLVSIAAGQASVTNANITDTRINAAGPTLLWDPIVVSDSTNQAASNTSYVKVPGTPLSVTFVAPASGSIWVTTTFRGEAATGTTSAILYTYQIRQNNSSGTIVVSPDDGVANQVQGENYVQASVRSLVKNLTPGSTYFLEDVVKTSTAGQTGNVWYRKITVEPR